MRLTAGLTQEALAERSGLSSKAIGELERSPDRTPRLDTVTMLAEALELFPGDRARLLAAARPPAVESHIPSRTPKPLHDLPRLLTPLIGRAGAVEAVASLVLRRDNQFVTLTGPGGVGKTRLAIEVAERVTDVFCDGVVFVDLSPIHDPALVLPTVAQHLGVDERGEIPLSDRLSSALRGKQLLLVLDNLEHLVAVGADLLGLLTHSPRLVVLATSRVPLRVRGEREYRVAPLELPPDSVSESDLERSASTALFLDRVRASGVDLPINDITLSAVAQICRRLDGLPLALELAAAWAPLLPPVALLERLEPRLPLLAGGPSDLPARQRTMFDAIAWSYDLLDPAEQRLFHQMAVFAGGCSLDAVAAVCGDGNNEHTVLQRLAALVDKNLLRREETDDGVGSPRVFMLETIREFGLQRLTESREAEPLRARHVRFFLDLAEEAAPALNGPDQLAWAARLERDQDNIRTALDWVCKRGDVGTGVRFAAALWPFWSVRGHGLEARRWLDRILALPAGAEPEPEAEARLKALIGSAVLALEYGALDDAGARIAHCLTLARGFSGQNVLVDALNASGQINRIQGEYGAAIEVLEEAYRLATATGYRAGEATSQYELALVIFLTGDATQAQELLEQCIALNRELDNIRGLAANVRDLGWMLWHAGDAARGKILREEALALFRALGDTGQVAETLWALGISAEYQGDHALATELFEESLSLRRSRGDDRGVAQVLSTLGQVALHQRDLPAARTMLTDGLDTVRGFGDRWGQAMILALLGHVELVSGDLMTAQEYFSEAAALYAELGNLLYLSWCLEGFAGLAMAEQRAEDAAFLLGAREAMLDIVGHGLPPADPPGLANVQEFVRATLGDFTVSEKYQMGQSLSLEDVVALSTEASWESLSVQPSE